MEQISPTETDAAFMHCCLTLSCSSYKTGGTALGWELRGGSCLQSSSARGVPGTVGVSPEPQPAEQRGGEGGAGPSLTWKRAGVASSGTCWWCFEQEICVQVVVSTIGPDLIISVVILGSSGRRVGGYEGQEQGKIVG